MLIISFETWNLISTMSLWYVFDRMLLCRRETNMEKTGQVPWVDTQLKLGPIMSRLFKQPDSPQMTFQFARMAERQAVNDTSYLASWKLRPMTSRFHHGEQPPPSTFRRCLQMLTMSRNI